MCQPLPAVHPNRLFARGGARRGLPVYLLSCLPLFYLAWINRHHQVDDALIYLRYVRNFLAGRGLVYNPGEYFNGLTAPLFSWLVILAGTLIENLQTANIVLAALLHAAALIVFAEVFFHGRSLATRAVFIVLGGTFPYFFLTYGMETPLFLLMIGLCLYCYQRAWHFRLGVFAGLLILTRPEGIFLVAVLLADFGIRQRRLPDYRCWIAPIVLVSTDLAFNRWYYGACLPATGLAKILQGQSGLWGGGWLFLQVSYVTAWVFDSNRLFMSSVSIAATAGFVGAVGFSRDRPLHWIAAIFLLLYSCFFVFLNIPNYHWYYAPYFMFALVYCMEGLCVFADTLEPVLRGTLGKLVGSVPFLFAVILIYWGAGISHAERGPFTPYKEIGLWLSRHTAENAKIAAVEIGTIGWYSDRQIIDILGLVNPRNARFIGERRFAEWLNHDSPDYILIHDPPWPHEAGAVAAREAGRFVPDPRFEFAGYGLLRPVDVARDPLTWPTRCAKCRSKRAFQGPALAVVEHRRW